MAKTTNLGALGRMGTIEPVTVIRDHSKSLRSASIEASNQSSSANSVGYSFFGPDQPDPSSQQHHLNIGARLSRQQRQQRNDDSSDGGQNSPDYLSSSSSGPPNALEAPCALKPSASTSCLLTTEDASSSSSSSNTLVCIPTRASLTHEWKRLKTPNKCRECNLLVYFNGRECQFCGFVAHKKCVTVLVIKCSGQQVCGSKSKQQAARRQQAAAAAAAVGAKSGSGGGSGSGFTCSGKPVAQPIFGQPIQENGPKVVDFVKRFIYEIDSRGLTSRGIYRVSSIKSKVDRLCNYYDQNISSLVDLSSFHPNIIANALKMYLRQLPEPLLTHRLYSNFIDVAKKYPKPKATNNEQKSSSSSSKAATPSSSQDSIAPHQTGYLVKPKRYLVATQLESPSTNQRRDYNPMLIVELSEIIELLPPVNLQVIALLMRHLRRVADMSDENQMSATNLSIIFGPTLLNADNNKSLAIVDNMHQARAVELLILWADKIFPQFDNYESKAVIELDFTELEQEQQRQREALEQLAHEREAKKRGQSKCNCPHHINSRDHDQPAANSDGLHRSAQDQWPKTRTEIMELRRQFFTLPTNQADVNRQPNLQVEATEQHRPVIATNCNDKRSGALGQGSNINDPRHRETNSNSGTGNNNNPKRGSPSLPMIKVQSHDTSNESGIRLFRRS